MRYKRVFLLSITTWIFVCYQALPTSAQTGTAAREAGEAVLKSLSKYFGKSSGSEVIGELTEFGGEAAVRQLARKAMAEGGESAVEQIAKTAGKYGPETILALQQSDTIAPVLKSLGELSEESIPIALQRLAANPAGKELSKNIANFGVRALKTEIAHPGIGNTLVRTLGDDGIEIASKLTREQGLELARHADDIALLPTKERAGIVQLLHQDAKAMTGFMGRFVEKNPGRTLFAAGTTTVILAESDRILGGDELVFDKNGIPHLVSKPGIAGRAMSDAQQSIVRPLMVYLIPIISICVAGWLGIKVWYGYQSSKLAFDRRKVKAEKEGTTRP